MGSKQPQQVPDDATVSGLTSPPSPRTSNNRDRELEAIQFLRKCAESESRIVSTGDLHEMQIAEARIDDRMFVDGETGLGFVILGWELTTDKDVERERVLRRQFYDDSTCKRCNGSGKVREAGDNGAFASYPCPACNT